MNATTVPARRRHPRRARDRRCSSRPRSTSPSTSSSRPGLADRMAPIDSPLGTLWVAWNGRGVSEVEQAADGAEAAARHEARTGRRTTLAEALPDAAGRRDRAPARGRDAGSGSRSTSAAAPSSRSPSGRRRSRSRAARSGRTAGSRPRSAARRRSAPWARRSGHNPVPLIVPCHRVVRTDGTIGQYSLGGPRNKRTILAAEGLDPDALEDAARRGERLSGSDDDEDRRAGRRAATRAGSRTATGSRSGRSARRGAKGYRPCKVCRPTAVEAAA